MQDKVSLSIMKYHKEQFWHLEPNYAHYFFHELFNLIYGGENLGMRKLEVDDYICYYFLSWIHTSPILQ